MSESTADDLGRFQRFVEYVPCITLGRGWDFNPVETANLLEFEGLGSRIKTTLEKGKKRSADGWTMVGVCNPPEP